MIVCDKNESGSLVFFNESICTFPKPLFVVVHGGAWISGSPSCVETVCRLLCDKYDAVCLAPRYRLASVNKLYLMSICMLQVVAMLSVIFLIKKKTKSKLLGICSVLFGILQCSGFKLSLQESLHCDLQVKDIVLELRWLLDNAMQYNCATTRICVIGHSAGAHLVSLMVLNEQYLKNENIDPITVQDIICVSGIYGEKHFTHNWLLSSLFVHGVLKSEKTVAAWPLDYVSYRLIKPRFLLLVAQMDWFLYDEMCTFVEILEKNDFVVQHHTIPKTTHLSICRFWDTKNQNVVCIIEDFLYGSSILVL